MINKFRALVVGLILAGAFPAAAQTGQPEDVCKANNTNLVEQMQKENPTEWQELLNQAAKTPNSTGLIWKLEKKGASASYLFGTMHFSDPRVMKLPQPAQEAYQAADTVIIETTDILDPKYFLRLKVEHPELLSFTDGTTLTSLLPADQLKPLEAKLASRGYVLSAMSKFKPWTVYAAMIIPACEMQRQTSGKPALDVWLAKNALDEGKRVAGLESAVEQLQAMNNVPMDIHIRSLITIADHIDKVEDAMETMIQLYVKQEVGLIELASRQSFPGAMTDSDNEQFMRELVVKRNKTMAERSLPYLEQGNAFIAVGALHLSGKQGLVELFRGMGYKVTRL